MHLKMPSELYAGEGVLKQLDEVVNPNERVALFTDQGVKNAGLLELILPQLGKSHVTVIDTVPTEPAVDEAWELIVKFKEIKAGVVIGFGGGSVLDVAKLASLLADNDRTLYQLLEHPLAAGRKICSVMIPTTAGTGAEATPNAIVYVPQEQLKVGVVNRQMIPDTVFLDPATVHGLPQPIAAASGVDALCHAMECYTSKKATQLSNLYAMDAMRNIVPNIIKACNEQDMQAQFAMMMGAYYAGVAISGSGTTAVHALSYPLGGRFRVPHGVSNAVLLVPVMKFNAPRCQKKMATIGTKLWPECQGATDDEKIARVLNELEKIVAALRIPKDLSSYGVTEEYLEELVESGLKVKRLLDNNMAVLTAEDARKIYREVLK